MSENKCFCENCRKDVNYTVANVEMEETLKGKTYQYIGKEAKCDYCGSCLYVPSINDYNLRSLYDVYRENNGIVPLSVILEIPKKYAIGKRPLSILLGWGEQTFSRYCDGDIPTKQYSDILLRIYNDPTYFSQLLDKGKCRLKSQSTYERSKKVVDELLDTGISSETKISLAVGYLLNKCEDITPLALQKALYYIQGFYYAFYNSFLFEEDCEAWVHGPVYREIYLKYRNYHFDPIAEVSHFDSTNLTTAEQSVFDSVVRNLCCYSGKILEQFTHNEAPWLSVRDGLAPNIPSERIISRKIMGEYFMSIKEKYGMNIPNDIRNYSLDMFQSIQI